MMMTDERPPVTANLILPILIKSILKQIEERSQEAALEIKIALLKAESAFPGIILDLVTKVTRQIDPNLDMTKALLSLQGSVLEFDDQDVSQELSNNGSSSNNNALVELNRRATILKRILSRIPSEISDRKLFLENIKEVASAIKKLLDSLTLIINRTQLPSRKQALEERKREFIKFSKRFSNRLKDFFKVGRDDAVFESAAHLINQIYAIQLLIKF